MAASLTAFDSTVKAHYSKPQKDRCPHLRDREQKAHAMRWTYAHSFGDSVRLGLTCDERSPCVDFLKQMARGSIDVAVV